MHIRQNQNYKLLYLKREQQENCRFKLQYCPQAYSIRSTLEKGLRAEKKTKKKTGAELCMTQTKFV